MKIEQRVNLPAIQEKNLNSTSSSQSERSNAISRQKDRFETAIETRKESALFEQKKSEHDYAVANVEGLMPPIIGAPLGTLLNMGKSDRAPLTVINLSEVAKDVASTSKRPINTESISGEADDAKEKESKSKEAEKQTSSDQRSMLEDLRLINAKIKIMS